MKGLAKSSKHYRLKPAFRGLQNLNGMTVRFPVLYRDEFGSRLGVDGGNWGDDGGCSSGGAPKSSIHRVKDCSVA